MGQRGKLARIVGIRWPYIRSGTPVANGWFAVDLMGRAQECSIVRVLPYFCFRLLPRLVPTNSASMFPIRFTVRALCVLTIASTLAFAQTNRSSQDLPRTHTPRPTSADITVEDVRTRTYIIADDSMEGRDTGKRGGLRSARYIAA